MGSLRRSITRILITTALAGGMASGGLGAGAAMAIPPEGGPRLQVSPSFGAPGASVQIRGSHFSCSRVSLYWQYNSPVVQLKYLGTIPPKAGVLQVTATVSADAQQGSSTIFSTGPSESGCDASTKFFICPTCVGDAPRRQEASPIRS